MSDAELTRLLAIIGVIAGTIGALAGMLALGWDFYKWRYAERVRLKVSATPNFLMFQPGLPTHMQSKEDLIWVSVTNTGKVPTTVKLITFHGFDSRWSQRKRNGKETSLVMTPTHGTLPAKLNPGDDWSAGFTQKNCEIYLKYKYFIVQN